MNFISRWLFAGLCAFLLATGTLTAQAAGQAGAPAASEVAPIKIAYTADPAASYTFVKGDSSKFRALEWAPAGFVAGARDFSASGKLRDGVVFESSGRAIPAEGDYAALLSLTEEDLGYVKFNFEQFRKFYANGGGVYRPFGDLEQNYTDKELALNIGKFGVEAGLTMKDLPEIVINYDREYKQGTKSAITWGRAYDGGTDSQHTRGIIPTWVNIDEITDLFNAKVSDTVNGYNWKIDQHLEYMRSNTLRNVSYITANAVPTASSNEDINYKEQMRSNLSTTTLDLDRWFLKEKVYAHSGYRFSEISGEDLLNVYFLKKTGEFLPGNNVVDSPADIKFASHTFVGSLMTTLLDPLTVITRGKIESSHREGESTTNTDTGSDGTINTINVNNNNANIMKYGESVSFRYSGFEHVALYNDYEFEQTDNNLDKYRQAISAGDNFDIRVIDSINRWSGTLGGQMTPWDKVTMTMQARHRVDENKYDPTINTTSGESSSNIQTWIKEQTIATDEATARVTWKPTRWFQPTLRYQLSNKGYKTYAYPDNLVPVDTAQIMSTYTTEVVSQPIDDLILSASFSFQDGKVITPDRFTGLPESVPTFNFDVYSTLISAEYSLSKDLVLTGTADYITAANFQDFSTVGMPFGADFYKADLTLGLYWTPCKDVKVEPKYAFYTYQANEAEVGSYNAQVVSLELKALWG